MSVASRTDRPGLVARAAGASREAARDPILRRVVVVDLVAAVLIALTVWRPGAPVSVLDGPHLPGYWLLLALTAATCLAELAVVRLRHGNADEELTLYEAALLIDVLLLPPHQALIAATVAMVAASVVQRRPPVKAMFNVGAYSAAVCALIAVVHVVGGTPGEIDFGVILGVLLGTLVFGAINLFLLAQILGVVTGRPPVRIIVAESRLSAFMAIGSVATGLTIVEMLRHAPLLLPFAAMPTLALTYAYRSAAHEADQRARAAIMLQLSQVLAERSDLVPRFLTLVREAFGADLAVVVMEGADVALTVDVETPADVTPGPVPAYLRTLAKLREPTFVTEGLPAGLGLALAVPVRTGDAVLGVASLAVWGRPRGRLSGGDGALFAPLASALAAAVQGAQHVERLATETSKLQAVVDQSTEGIVVVDGAGTVQLHNQAFAELTALAAPDITGRRLVEVLDVPDRDQRTQVLPVTPEQPKLPVELAITRRDGEQRHLRLAHSAVFDGDDLVRDVVVITDLTREYRAERLKSDFIATVSHELRTPLTPIIGYLDLLRNRGDKMPAEKRAGALDLIADRAKHMSRLVEDLLLASRVGDGEAGPALQVTMGTHDFVAIVRQVTDDLASARIVTDLPDEPIPVGCDQGRTVQVVANLVGNALKYSPETEQVRVGIRRADGRAYVDVADDGPGIPADHLEKVFEKFHRIEDPMTMRTGGTGLGLFIARRLAQAMGGDLTLDSKVGVGSVFTFSLPLAGG
ncbi:sensor histidine kinase [Actinoplanes subtropicus]|uniref:sensor histidine kinase n=1 Tax=Actinoplanes subtropicus TaxID=543632 RepID=UPI0004C39513|nr:ATP-binding protein [Actinoplanes subtropicus]